MKKTKTPKEKPQEEVKTNFTIPEAVDKFNDLIKQGLLPDMLMQAVTQVEDKPVTFGMAYKLEGEEYILACSINFAKMKVKDEDKEPKLITV